MECFGASCSNGVLSLLLLLLLLAVGDSKAKVATAYVSVILSYLKCNVSGDLGYSMARNTWMLLLMFLCLLR